MLTHKLELLVSELEVKTNKSTREQEMLMVLNHVSEIDDQLIKPSVAAESTSLLASVIWQPPGTFCQFCKRNLG